MQIFKNFSSEIDSFWFFRLVHSFRILVPWSRTEPGPAAVRVPGPNHRPTGNSQKFILSPLMTIPYIIISNSHGWLVKKKKNLFSEIEMIVGLFEQLGYTSNDLKISFLMSSKSWVPLCVSCFFRPLTSDQSSAKLRLTVFLKSFLGSRVKSLFKEKIKTQDPMLEGCYFAVVEGNEEGTSNNHSKFLSK